MADAAEETDRLFVLTLSCPDRRGIVADVAQFLSANACNIVESAQFGDPVGGNFFMRVCFRAEGALQDRTDFQQAFRGIAAEFGMTAAFSQVGERSRALIMVSRFGHCLNDLLFRWRIGALDMDIPAVVSNHGDFEKLVDSYDLPFVHLPVTKETKAEQEAKLLDLIDREQVDLVVLARYMQVLSPELCRRLPGRVINIHHSFLPSFKGARPYHQAHTRGVKLVGATAHYVTEDLDEGPIIEQDVTRVDHAMSGEDFVSMGRDIECVVLARALKWHLEHRVLLNGSRTVVFR
jgi:formyltetrahydrofolate deformylase